MADGLLDAFLVFGPGTAGNGKDAPYVRGESADQATNFDKELIEFYPMQISSYKLGFELHTEGTEETADKGGEASAHEPDLGNVTIEKGLDSASPSLLNALCVSASYEKVWIWQRKAGAVKGGAGDYFLKIRLRDVTVANIEWTASDGQQAPAETLTLKYEQIHIEYITQDKTGKLNKPTFQYTWPEPGTRHSRKRNGKADGGSDLSQSQMQDVATQVLTKIKNLNPRLNIRVK